MAEYIREVEKIIDAYHKQNPLFSLNRKTALYNALTVFEDACRLGKNMKGNFENVGYAKVDKAGIYNILIMEEKQSIIALGAGGSSKLVFDHGKRIERVENVKDVTSYIARIDEMIERKRTGIGTWL